MKVIFILGCITLVTGNAVYGSGGGGGGGGYGASGGGGGGGGYGGGDGGNEYHEDGSQKVKFNIGFNIPSMSISLPKLELPQISIKASVKQKKPFTLQLPIIKFNAHANSEDDNSDGGYGAPAGGAYAAPSAPSYGGGNGGGGHDGANVYMTTPNNGPTMYMGAAPADTGYAASSQSAPNGYERPNAPYNDAAAASTNDNNNYQSIGQNQNNKPQATVSNSNNHPQQNQQVNYHPQQSQPQQPQPQPQTHYNQPNHQMNYMPQNRNFIPMNQHYRSPNHQQSGYNNRREGVTYAFAGDNNQPNYVRRSAPFENLGSGFFMASNQNKRYILAPMMADRINWRPSLY